MEYIGIHPVIILTKGHCFPGYWRNWESHQSFVEDYASKAPKNVETEFPFQFVGPSSLTAIQQFMDRRAITALETVRLAFNESIGEAEVRGRKKLRRRSTFDALLDVNLARRNNVTPLPI